MLRAELYRIVHRKWFYLFLGAGVCVGLGGFVQQQFTQISMGSAPHEYNGVYVFLQIFGANFNSFWGGVIPLIAVLAASDLLCADLATGFSMPMMLRVGVRKYFVDKFIANAIAVFMGTVIFLTIDLGIAILWRGDLQWPPILKFVMIKGLPQLTHGETAFSGVIRSSYQPLVLPWLFWHVPYAFTALEIVINGLVLTTVSSIAVIAALWIRNRYLVLATPFLVYWALNVGLQFMHLFQWIPTSMGGSFFFTTAPFTAILLYWTVPLALLFLILLLAAPRRYLRLSLSPKETNR